MTGMMLLLIGETPRWSLACMVEQFEGAAVQAGAKTRKPR